MASSLLTPGQDQRSATVPAGRHQRPLRERLEPYLLISPTMLLILGLMVIPIVIVIGYSLMDNVVTNPTPKFVGISNYVTILTTPAFWSAAGNTLIFTVGSVVAHMVIGILFALMLNSKTMARVPRAIFRAIYILPWIFTASVVAVLWRLLLDPSGVINYLFTSVGLLHEAVPWLATASTALLAVTVINIWSGYPFFMISLLAGLQGVPTDLYEAARVDGAGFFRQFVSVTLPALKPILYSMALLDLLWTTQQFTLIWATTGGGPLERTEVLSTFTYKLAFNSYQFSMAATSAVIVLAGSLVVAVFYVRRQRKAAQR
ncbi:carbohydrate ABC transporter permease [Arthrobacter sp. SDTb3-6]|uniref:carbohydrate ABC transporter permease n=1 Tax=Arthrobacter sp. SDTb3-6 TaxID=2713571 RepID=UPI00159E013E|nr:sugar ABC transporter permease [Arthrobacter sp. SDTb3-6]NVM98129.1 sugar ABC transporter permease [Arthrobacter sp. SDTb3-6]